MSAAPLREVEQREYVETLACGHKVSWCRPGPGTGSQDWPKLVKRRRCVICGGRPLDGWWTAEGDSCGCIKRANPDRVNGGSWVCPEHGHVFTWWSSTMVIPGHIRG